MARTNFDIIRGLMIADNTLDSWILEIVVMIGG